MTERMSEEVHSDIHSFPMGETDLFPELNLANLFSNPDIPSFPVSGECDPYALIGEQRTLDPEFSISYFLRLDSLGTSSEPNEFDRYLGPDPLASKDRISLLTVSDLFFFL